LLNTGLFNEIHCEGKLKLRSYSILNCLIEVVTKVCLTVLVQSVPITTKVVTVSSNPASARCT
jgi:hypothetical protein